MTSIVGGFDGPASVPAWDKLATLPCARWDTLRDDAGDMVAVRPCYTPTPVEAVVAVLDAAPFASGVVRPDAPSDRSAPILPSVGGGSDRPADAPLDVLEPEVGAPGLPGTEAPSGDQEPVTAAVSIPAADLMLALALAAVALVARGRQRSATTNPAEPFT